MEKRISLLRLVMFLCALSNRENGKAGARDTLSEVNSKLKLLNKPAVKTIKSEDGDIIDCVDIYKQPALDHPALKNHIIQMKPSFKLATEISSAKHNPSRAFASQTWQRSGSCPTGTIPIRRIRRQELLRSTSLDDFGRKKPPNPNAENKIPDQYRHFNNTKNTVLQENISTAKFFTNGYNYFGASGDINVWNPHVDKPDEYSTAQIWLKAGTGDTTIESVESGWVVNPALYGDSRTRLFAYWTADAYKNTGCFDLTCAGFVQTSSETALGAALEPGSSSSTQQYVISINISLDPDTHNWWLKYNGNNIGYWPESLFNNLKKSAIYVEWGGLVYSPNVKKSPHTATAMGSGNHAETQYGHSCYIEHARIVDDFQESKFPDWVSEYADENNCYSVFNGTKENKGEPLLFFGGPGQNPDCP